MEATAILNANFLDILFDGRNKAYGAYDLRKTYNRRLVYAFGITAGIILFLFIATLIAAAKKHTHSILADIPEIVIKGASQEKAVEKIKPITKVKPQVSTVRSVMVKIVKDNQVDPSDKPPTVDQINNARVDITTNAGNNNDDGIVAPAGETTGTAVVVKPIEDDNNGIVENVQVQAKFPGGAEAWKRYLSKHLDPGVPLNNGAPEGVYTVIVKFVVSKDGSIRDIECDNDPGFGIGAQVIKIIKDGPAWIPALYNGHNVNAYHLQPVTFVLADPES